MNTTFIAAALAGALGVLVSGYQVRALACEGFWARFTEVMFLLVPALLALYGDDPLYSARLGLMGVVIVNVWLGLAVYDRQQRRAA